MSYITYGTSGLGAYYTSPVRRVAPSYSGFGAPDAGFDPASLFAQWQAWLPICAPLKGKATCTDPGKKASVGIVQAALLAAGFDPKGVDGTWGTNSRAAWAAFARSNPGVTPSGDSYESFTLSDFQTLARKAYGWMGGSGGASTAGMLGGGRGILLIGVAAVAVATIAVVTSKRKRGAGSSSVA